MIPQALIKQVKDFAYAQSEKYSAPALFHLELANEKGQWLAKLLKADKDVVLIGTLLMDCMIGPAIQEGMITKHIEMSITRTKELLNEFPNLDKKVKENILHCIKQHHGVDKFYSLETEICCNADCYRFASVKGVIGGLTNPLNFSVDELVNLYLKKAEEKWNALTLDTCKKELEPQYKAIKSFLKYFNR